MINTFWLLNSKLTLYAIILLGTGFILAFTVQPVHSVYVFDYMWGTKGTGNAQFNLTADAARDSSRNIFVVDAWNNRIQKFHLSNPCTAGTTQVVPGVCFVTKWGSLGSADGQFNVPIGIALDSSGNVYVADVFNHRIQKFTNDGTFIRSWGSAGSGNGQFLYPSDVAVDSSGNVYVADEANNRTQKFGSDGHFIRAWGTKGTGNGEFNMPQGVAVDSSGNVFVSDSLNGRVQKFSNTGSFKTAWTQHGPGTGIRAFPYGIAVDSVGNVYVEFSFNNRIEKFTNNGTFVDSWGEKGTGNGQFDFPSGIDVVTPQKAQIKQYVFVSDESNNRIQVFEWKPVVHQFKGPTNNTNVGSLANNTFIKGIDNNTATGATVNNTIAINATAANATK
jgi:DNA-binding beta-propeller fold protein YncE